MNFVVCNKLFVFVTQPGAFQVFEDLGGGWGVVVVFDGFGEVFPEVGEVGSEHLSEGFEDFLLGGFRSAEVSEETVFEKGENDSVEVDFLAAFAGKADEWGR